MGMSARPFVSTNTPPQEHFLRGALSLPLRRGAGEGDPLNSHGGKVIGVCLQSLGSGRRLLSKENGTKEPCSPAPSAGCFTEIKCQAFVQWPPWRSSVWPWHCVPVQSGSIPLLTGSAVAQPAHEMSLFYPGKEKLRIYCTLFLICIILRIKEMPNGRQPGS